jgi:hypothetical protein
LIAISAGNRFAIYIQKESRGSTPYSVPAEYYCHFVVATQPTAEGSADISIVRHYVQQKSPVRHYVQLA